MIFVVTLALLVFVGNQLRVALDSFTVTWERVRELPDLEKDAWYMAYNDFNVDHYILFHGFGEPIRQARAADVIFVGSSQTQYAFPRDVLEQASDESGLHFYNLAFAHAEASAFVAQLIEKNELSPQVVVASAGLFFRDTASAFGRQVMEATLWDAWKTVFERTIASQVQYGLLGWLPRWELPTGPERRPIVLYRSQRYGSWFATRESFRFSLARDEPEDLIIENTTDSLVHAQAFHQLLSDRGIDLVLTTVPPRLLPRRNVAELANALGVPLIVPSVPGLMTRDLEHLTDLSGERFASEFLREFLEWAAQNGVEPRRPDP